MSNDARRDEAKDLHDRAAAASANGQYEIARRLLEKSLSTYETGVASDLLFKVEAKLRHSRQGPNMSVPVPPPRTEPTPSTDSTEGPRRRPTGTSSTRPPPNGSSSAQSASSTSAPRGPSAPRFENSGGSAKTFSSSNSSSSTSASSSNDTRSSTAGPSSSNSSSTSSGPGTGAEARRTAKTTDLYKVLEISRDADEAAIKAAYRKLALKFHPDKNPSPEAEEAFKRVSHAYTVLSDSQKRRIYDETGAEDGRGGGMANGFARAGPRGGGFHFEEELTPEDLFNMFFGGVNMPRRSRGPNSQEAPPPRQQFQQRFRRAEPGDSQQGFNLMQFAHFLPLIVLFLFSVFASSGSQSSAPFSMQQTPAYNIQRATASGTIYYVNPQFQWSYGRDPRALAKVEGLVEESYFSAVREDCKRERAERENAIEKAKQVRASDPELRRNKLASAYDIKTPACDRLRTLAKDPGYA